MTLLKKHIIFLVLASTIISCDLWSQLPSFTFREYTVENVFATNDFEPIEKVVAGISYRKLNSLPGRTNTLAAANVKAKIVGTKNFTMSMGLSLYQNKRGVTNFGYSQYGYFLTNSLNMSKFSNLTVGIAAFLNTTSLDMDNLEWDNQYVDHFGYDSSLPSQEQLNFSSSKFLDFSAGISFSRKSNKKNGGKSINQSMVTGIVFSHLSGMSMDSADNELYFKPKAEAFLRVKIGIEDKSIILLPELYYSYDSGLTDLLIGNFLRLNGKMKNAGKGKLSSDKSIDFGILINPNSSITPAFRVQYGMIRFAFGFEFSFKNQKESRGVGGGIESNLGLRI